MCMWHGLSVDKEAQLPPIRKVLPLDFSFCHRTAFSCEPGSCNRQFNPRKGAQGYPGVKARLLGHSDLVKNGNIANVWIFSVLAAFSSQEGWVTGHFAHGCYLRLMFTFPLVGGYSVYWVFLMICEEYSNLTISAGIWSYNMFSEMPSLCPVFPVLMNFGSLIYHLMRSHANL